jgi:hypothetical protein
MEHRTLIPASFQSFFMCVLWIEEKTAKESDDKWEEVRVEKSKCASISGTSRQHRVLVGTWARHSMRNKLVWIFDCEFCVCYSKHNSLSLSHTHTQEKNSEWLQLQTVLISQNQQNLWKTSKPNFFSKLENQANLFENLKTKKSLKKQQNFWKLQNQEIFETLDFNSNDVLVKVLQITRELLEIFHPNVINFNFCLILT